MKILHQLSQEVMVPLVRAGKHNLAFPLSEKENKHSLTVAGSTSFICNILHISVKVLGSFKVVEFSNRMCYPIPSCVLDLRNSSSWSKSSRDGLFHTLNLQN